METRTSQIIKSGIKNNSMYEKDAVICDATIDETNKYYALAEQYQSDCKVILEPMSIFDVSKSKPNKSQVKVEIIEDELVKKLTR